MKDFAGGNPFDALDTLGGTIGGHGLYQEMDVILVGANLSKDPRIPLRDLPTHSVRTASTWVSKTTRRYLAGQTRGYIKTET